MDSSPLLTLVDPNSTTEAVEQANAILQKSRGSFHVQFEEPRTVAAICNGLTDRLVALARLLPQDGIENRQFPELEAKLIAQLGKLVDKGSDTGAARANALVAVLHRLGAIARVPARDLEWTLVHACKKPTHLYAALSAWCEAHDPVPLSLARVIQKLRDSECDSPIVDRLAAWTSPSARGMLDLARWENGYRSAADPEFSNAAERWKQGKWVPSDSEILADSLDSNTSSCAWALEIAMNRHGKRALQALDQAIRKSKKYPILRVILNGWRQRLRAGSLDRQSNEANSWT
jgi:hypothetical protein